MDGDSAEIDREDAHRDGVLFQTSVQAYTVRFLNSPSPRLFVFH